MKHHMVSRREAARERLRGYVRRRVLPALGAGGADFELDVPAEGTRSVVLFIRTRTARFVLRCLPSPARAMHTVLAARHMERRGAPVPRVLFADLSPLTLLRYRNVFVVEEAIPGRSLVEVARTDPRLRAAARALAALHAIRRERWGSLVPGLGRRDGYFEFLQGRLKRRLEDLTTESPQWGAVLAAPAIAAWFARQGPAVRSLEGYSLCHLRVSATNVLFADDGEARLIDLVTARYGDPAVDLERALYRWCDAVPYRERVFLDEYFAAAAGKAGADGRETAAAAARAAWLRRRPYHRASFHLTQAYRAAKEMRGFLAAAVPRRKKARRRQRTLRRHLGLLLAALGQAADAPSAAVLGGAHEALARACGGPRPQTQTYSMK